MNIDVAHAVAVGEHEISASISLKSADVSAIRPPVLVLRPGIDEVNRPVDSGLFEVRLRRARGLPERLARGVPRVFNKEPLHYFAFVNRARDHEFRDAVGARSGS